MSASKRDVIRPVDRLRETKTIEERRARVGYAIIGQKICLHCPNCGQLVQLNKPLLGSLHFCV